MVVQHNIAALNAYRQFGTNTSAVSKNLEKLSSGYAINRAGDDASGLAISEKMRAQISGLQVAQDNAQDGISLVQTAEGALTEVHSMLNRMVELAEKSANGTIQDDVDREAIQKEVNDIISEVDRISESTNFNGITLLDGTLGGTTNTFTAGTDGASGVTLSGGNFTGTTAATTFTFSAGATQAASTIAVSGTHTGVSFAVDSSTGTAADGSITFVASVADTATVADKDTFEGLRITVSHDALDAAGTDSTAIVAAGAVGGGLKLQIGDSNDDYQKVTVTVDDLSSTGLGINGLDVSSQDAAGDSIQKIKDAINQVSTNRGNLGGLQNRLEYTINNLSVTEENMTAAESNIRDTDMAAEMMAYTKNNVLTQAAQAMLAQANTQPQSVLQLLQ